MSSCCRIGLVQEDGTVRHIYCHTYGESCYMGDILNQHYNDKETISKLLDLGNIHFLGELPVSPDWSYYDRGHDDRYTMSYATRTDERKSLEHNKAITHKDITEFASEFPHYLVLCVYLFNNGEWNVYDWSKRWRTLSEELEESEEFEELEE